MAELVALLEGIGCTDVATYIQSGNAVVSAGAALGARLSGQLAAAIADRFGYEVSVTTRRAGELRRVVESNPFLVAGADPKALHVGFLAAAPTPEAVARLDPDRSPGDSFAVRGREIYLHLPRGAGRTKLDGAFLARLGTPCTVRNWRTVVTLQQMCA